MELVRSLIHPIEAYALLQYKFGVGGAAFLKLECSNSASAQLKKCYKYFDKTSRSFAAVTRALDDELRDVVCIFYLVLRALDTVEDDMTIPYDEKVTMLRNFYKFLEDPSWNYTKSKDKYRIVLEDFTTISSQFRLLKPVYRDVISDICRQMGANMTIFVGNCPVTFAQWDECSRNVTGLAFSGFSQLFSISELEDRLVGEKSTLPYSMGILLHKTNNIRDYYEDMMEGRQFWPKEVWSKCFRNLIELSEPDRIDDAISCLNELITNALWHIPDVMNYLSLIRNQSVFAFHAMHQVLAIATLERCYSNRQVFRGVVKIRKGEAIWLMMQATNMDNVKAIFSHYLKQIRSKISSTDPSARVTRQAIETLTSSTCNIAQLYPLRTIIHLLIFVFAVLFLAIVTHYWPFPAV